MAKWESDPIVEQPTAAAKPKWAADPIEFQIDWAKPVETVRAEIAKLPEADREQALRQWADAFVAAERKAQGALGTINNVVRTISRGTFVGPFLDELNAGTSDVVHKLTGGAAGAPYAEVVAYERAKDRAVDAKNPAMSVVGKLGGGLAGGGAALKVAKEGHALTSVPGVTAIALGGPLARMAPAATRTGQAAQGATVGGVYGYASGFGNAEGDLARRHDAGVDAILPGMAVGAVAPSIISGVARGANRLIDLASPQIARVGGTLSGLRDKLAIRASHEGSGPAVSPGADAAAEQVIANQLARANVNLPMLRQRLADADEAVRLDSNSRAQNVLAPVDLDPSLQRLAGSVARQQPEAGNIGAAFQYARQTGQPSGLPLPSTAGLPTRPAMARPSPDDPPMGQYERVKDALKRAMRLEDHKSHGHGRNAYETEQQMMRAAREEAKALYDDAYQAGQNVDLRPVIAPVFEKWTARLDEEPVAVGRAIRDAMRQFTTANGGVVGSLERFDKGKQFLDGKIENWLTGAEGRNRYVGGVLNQLKKDLLEAVDSIPLGEAGAKYAAARAQFGSRAEMREALQLGRDVFKKDSDVVVDQFRQLSPGQQKIFRLGLLDSFEHHMGRQKRSADVTQVFESPRIQQILEAVIPRSDRTTAVFANRPERFGQYLASEKQMIGTRNKTMGNSATAERLADDQALDGLQSMVEAARTSLANPTPSNVAMRMIEWSINKAFGYRADTSAAIAKKLYTADPAERERLLSAIERRLGPSRSAQFAELTREYQAAIAQGSAAVAAGAPKPPERK